jgi:hypothetical protein
VPARAIALAALLAAGCGPGVFACDEDVDCGGADESGLCEANGYCSFPDAACPSGRRYGERGPAGIAGSCVPVGEGETGDATGSGSVGSSVGEGPTSTTSAGSSVGPTATTEMVDDTGSSEGSSPSTTTGAASESSSSAGGSTTAGKPFVVEYAATLAVCTEVGVHDIEHCALEAGEDEFTIDVADVDGNISNGWLRFDLDGALQGAEILSVDLVLRVGSDEFDAADQSGELWLVDAFDAAALGTGDPAAIELVVADQGPVALDAEVTFTLPTDLVAPDSAVYFGLFAVTSDGLDYYGHTAAAPPHLVITAQ